LQQSAHGFILIVVTKGPLPWLVHISEHRCEAGDPGAVVEDGFQVFALNGIAGEKRILYAR
jgi:hypothetical protein